MSFAFHAVSNQPILLDIRYHTAYLCRMDTPKHATKKLTAIRIDQPDLDALGVIAADSGRSVASCIREAIKDWVRARVRKAAKKPAEPAPF